MKRVGSKILCKKNCFFQTRVDQSKILSKLINFIHFIKGDFLYKKGKTYKVVQDLDNVLITNSEMNEEQIFLKKYLEKYFYTESQIRKRKLKRIKKK